MTPEQRDHLRWLIEKYDPRLPVTQQQQTQDDLELRRRYGLLDPRELDKLYTPGSADPIPPKTGTSADPGRPPIEIPDTKFKEPRAVLARKGIAFDLNVPGGITREVIQQRNERLRDSIGEVRAFWAIDWHDKTLGSFFRKVADMVVVRLLENLPDIFITSMPANWQWELNQLQLEYRNGRLSRPIADVMGEVGLPEEDYASPSDRLGPYQRREVLADTIHIERHRALEALGKLSPYNPSSLVEFCDAMSDTHRRMRNFLQRIPRFGGVVEVLRQLEAVWTELTSIARTYVSGIPRPLLKLGEQSLPTR